MALIKSIEAGPTGVMGEYIRYSRASVSTPVNAPNKDTVYTEMVTVEIWRDHDTRLVATNRPIYIFNIPLKVEVSDTLSHDIYEAMKALPQFTGAQDG